MNEKPNNLCLKAITQHVNNSPRNTSELVIHDPPRKTKVFSTNRLARGRLRREFKFVIEGGPSYCIEPVDTLGQGTFFLRRTKNNKLVGLLKDCKLEKSQELVEKLFYLSKLDLIPQNRANECAQNNDTNNLNGNSI